MTAIKTQAAAISLIFLIIFWRSGLTKSQTNSILVLTPSANKTKPMADATNNHSTIVRLIIKPNSKTLNPVTRCILAFGSLLNSINKPLKAHLKLCSLCFIDNKVLSDTGIIYIKIEIVKNNMAINNIIALKLITVYKVIEKASIKANLGDR